MPDHATTAPRRVQRTRRKGAVNEPAAVYVGRGSRWGNPHRLQSQDDTNRVWIVAKFRADLLAGRLGVTVEDVRRELRGRNLSCWCKPSEPCHADVLIEVANEPVAGGGAT